MAEDQVQITPATKTFDLATVIGLIGAFSLIGAAIYLGGSPRSFVNLQSLLIVLALLYPLSHY